MIYRFALAQVECASQTLPNNYCKQNITSLSLMVGTTVYNHIVNYIIVSLLSAMYTYWQCENYRRRSNQCTCSRDTHKCNLCQTKYIFPVS